MGKIYYQGANVVNGGDNNRLSPETKRKISIVLYSFIGALLFAGIVYAIFFFNPNDIPFIKNGKKGKAVAAGKETIVDIPVGERFDADSGFYTFIYDDPTKEMLFYKSGEILQGYARCEHCETVMNGSEHHTDADFTLYNDGVHGEDFINTWGITFSGCCIDPGHEAPHDGTNKTSTNRYDGNKVGNGEGKDWWYGYKDYGYTATLERHKEGDTTVYDWTVLVNFGYGEKLDHCQRMKFHVVYFS